VARKGEGHNKEESKTAPKGGERAPLSATEKKSSKKRIVNSPQKEEPGVREKRTKRNGSFQVKREKR